MTVVPQEEEGKFYAEIERKCNVQLSNLAAKQEKALKAFDDKFANQRWCALPHLRPGLPDFSGARFERVLSRDGRRKLVHERKLAFGQLRQRYKNNLSDMRGAHVRLQPSAQATRERL